MNAREQHDTEEDKAQAVMNKQKGWILICLLYWNLEKPFWSTVLSSNCKPTGGSPKGLSGITR